MSARRRAQPDVTPVPPSDTDKLAEEFARKTENLRVARLEAERSRQALIDEAERLAKEQELAILEGERQLQEEMEQMKQAEEERAKAEEEARKAEEAKRKEEEDRARQAEDAKKKEKKKSVQSTKKQANDSKGKARAVDEEDNEIEGEQSVEGTNASRARHSEDEQPAPGNKYSKSKKNATKTPTMINDSGKNLTNEIVQGGLYPSCVACVKAEKPCHWKMSVIHLRLAGLPNKAKNCEDCIRKQIGCQFIWERDESLKRVADDSQDPESSKRVKIDCPDLVDVLQNIDKNIGALVKYTAAQALKTSKDQEATSEMFATIKDSLEGLHQKYNDN